MIETKNVINLVSVKGRFNVDEVEKYCKTILKITRNRKINPSIHFQILNINLNYRDFTLPSSF